MLDYLRRGINVFADHFTNRHLKACKTSFVSSAIVCVSLSILI